jgi:hypothetical protein
MRNKEPVKSFKEESDMNIGCSMRDGLGLQGHLRASRRLKRSEPPHKEAEEEASWRDVFNVELNRGALDVKLNQNQISFHLRIYLLLYVTEHTHSEHLMLERLDALGGLQAYLRERKQSSLKSADMSPEF